MPVSREISDGPPRLYQGLNEGPGWVFCQYESDAVFRATPVGVELFHDFNMLPLKKGPKIWV